MNVFRRDKRVWVAPAIALVAAVAGACNKEPRLLGEAVPADAERVSIESLLQDKARYAGRTVVVEGRVGGVGCVDCGGVLITDRTWRLLVEPADSRRFQIAPRKGALIRAWGVVKVEKLDKAEAGHEPAPEKKDVGEGDAHERLHEELGNLELKAKGVEWL